MHRFRRFTFAQLKGTADRLAAQDVDDSAICGWCRHALIEHAHAPQLGRCLVIGCECDTWVDRLDHD